MKPHLKRVRGCLSPFFDGLPRTQRYFVKRTAQVDLRSLNRNVPGSVTMLMDPEKDVKGVPLWCCTYQGIVSWGRTPLEAYTKAVYHVTELA